MFHAAVIHASVRTAAVFLVAMHLALHRQDLIGCALLGGSLCVVLFVLLFALRPSGPFLFIFSIAAKQF